ncbi:MAG: glutamyl-tRNA reductase [Gammaproteobacteria bacterium]|nr:glutamyl-tRNA reductase [Gammaproteobacteria bacterium]MBK81885.1 glutamyl-tRNA reductase [Gammaproteobacteria bacterium]|tara:strand:- start:1210 stop:2463 length:1254 start_codon:yes stop_codon:yes gene_type:complete
MAILAYGLNYRTAPVEVRERIAFPEESLAEALVAIRESVPTLSEAAIVSTCNRTELYAALDPADERLIPAWLASYRRIEPTELASMAYTYWDADAARHLIRVASGLDSQVLGEPQILGQVKTAYDIARSAGTLGPELNLLSQVTLSAAKRVRTDTEIGRNPVSVAYAAVVMAQQIFSELASKRALLLGAGDTIQKVAEHLSALGIGALGVANRTLANAEALAGRFNARAMQLTDVATHLHEYDIVIASTGSALPVLGKGAVEHAIKVRRRRPMFIVDIAIPRDVEPEVADLSDVYLYTIDDLTDIIEENVRQRREAAESAELLVDDGATHFVRERRAHQSRELLKRFRDQAEAVKGAELERALRELKAGGDPEAVVNTLARSITNKLIHQPTVAIREASADGRADLIEYLKTLYRLD